MDSNNKASFNIVDILVLLFLGCLCLSSLLNDSMTDVRFQKILIWGCLYGITRTILLVAPRVIPTILLLTIATVLIGEIILGSKQMLLGSYSGLSSINCTGSFLNSGPFGGFLSFSICLLLSYIITTKDISRPIKWFLAMLLIPAVILLFLSFSRAAVLSFLLCNIIFINRYKKTWIRRYGIYLAIIILPVIIVSYYIKKPSADARLYINGINLEIIKEKPIGGSGFNSFRREFGLKQKQYFIDQILKSDAFGSEKEGDMDEVEIMHKMISSDYSYPGFLEDKRMKADIPDVAFNEYCQIAIENGLFASIAFIALIICSIVSLYKSESPWAYALISLSIFALFSYPFSYFLFKFLLMFAISLAALDCKIVVINRRFIPFAFVTSSVLGLLLLLPSSSDYNKAKKVWKNEIKKMYWLEDYKSYVSECESLFNYLQKDTEFLYTYGDALYKIGALSASENIYTIGSEISNDNKFYIALGLIKKEMNDFDAAESYFCKAYLLVPNRLYPLYLLADLYYQKDDVEGFLKTEEFIKRNPPKIENENTRVIREKLDMLNNTFVQKTY